METRKSETRTDLHSSLKAVVAVSLVALGLATGLAWPHSIAIDSGTGISGPSVTALPKSAIHLHALMPWDVLGHMHFSIAPARRGCKSELLPVTNDPKSLARCANLRHLPASV